MTLGVIRALAGIGELTNLYDGRHIGVYELITSASERSRGYGKALMDRVETLARDLGCDTVALASGLQRADAHRFYEDKWRCCARPAPSRSRCAPRSLSGRPRPQIIESWPP